MNLTNFLKQTDTLTSQCSTEQLISFIHGIGRICPEYRREDFLKILKSRRSAFRDEMRKYGWIDTKRK